jgi:TrmH family RNA methyltransferase
MTLITSPSNPKIKQVRTLLSQRKARQESGLFVVEGIQPVGAAVEAAAARGSVTIEMILYDPDSLSSAFALRLVEDQSRTGIACYSTTRTIFDSVASKENPQGILAVVSLSQPSLAELTPENFPWGVALVTPQDPGNVGTILRTIDAVGAAGLLVLDGGADLHHPAAVRASMGSLFWHPIVTVTFGEFRAWAAQHGYHLYGTSAHASQEISTVASYSHPCVLVLGSERQGLSPEQAATCTTMLRLPMHGRISSLNLAVAAGILLYDMLAKSG